MNCFKCARCTNTGRWDEAPVFNSGTIEMSYCAQIGYALGLDSPFPNRLNGHMAGTAQRVKLSWGQGEEVALCIVCQRKLLGIIGEFFGVKT